MATPDRLVVDANILFSALLRDSSTRRLLLHAGLDLYTPAWLWHKMERNRAYLVGKSHATNASFDLLVQSLADRIRDLPDAVLRPHMHEALRRVGADGRLDAPYVAAAIAIDARIWTHDATLAQRAGVPVVVTADLIP